MKPPPSGAGRRKTYYLTEAMQFCLPYIKTLNPPSLGNLPPPPNTPNETPEFEGDVSDVDDTMDSSRTVSTPPPSTYSTPTTPIRAKRNTSKKKEDVDKCVAEYFKVKKSIAELQANKDASLSVDKKESLRMFLLSLIPELEELSDNQIKLFKRKVFQVIDEISNETLSQNSNSSSLLNLDTYNKTSNLDPLGVGPSTPPTAARDDTFSQTFSYHNY